VRVWLARRTVHLVLLILFATDWRCSRECACISVLVDCTSVVQTEPVCRWPPPAAQLTTRATLPGRRPPLFVNKVRYAHYQAFGERCRPICSGLVLATHEMPYGLNRHKAVCHYFCKSAKTFNLHNHNKARTVCIRPRLQCTLCLQ